MDNFIEILKETWNEGIRGFGIGEIIICLVIIVVSWLIGRLLSTKLIDWLSKKAGQTDNRLDDKILESLRNPLGLIPIVFGFYLITFYLPLEGSVDFFATTIVKMLVIFTIFSALANLCGPLLSLLDNKWMTEAMVDWLRKTLEVLIWIIAAAMILDIWGIQVGPIIAGLGLFGVALALGAQDVFKNIFAGIFILSENRFQKGDRIRIGDSLHGIVDHIGFRSTTVRLFDSSPVFVPNADLSDAQVVNHQLMEIRRLDWTINLTYSTKIDQLKSICLDIESYIKDKKNLPVDLTKDNFVKVSELGASSIDLKLICHTDPVGFADFSDVKEKLIFKIIEAVESNGSDFAFPSQSIYVENQS
ncbi:MAG: mechanosensitive ion channel family protein [SAR86 cluster bacterium]|jgi:MscS family membrane protein|nr:mechanosensitive ion channel family protein [SAR86 cluster bacterium]|tara:strand:+ start:630 stop:1709 length:1080 start_codon:yes stop_codon:yes gene_type:complete